METVCETFIIVGEMTVVFTFDVCTGDATTVPSFVSDTVMIGEVLTVVSFSTDVEGMITVFSFDVGMGEVTIEISFDAVVLTMGEMPVVISFDVGVGEMTIVISLAPDVETMGKKSVVTSFIDGEGKSKVGVSVLIAVVFVVVTGVMEEDTEIDPSCETELELSKKSCDVETLEGVEITKEGVEVMTGRSVVMFVALVDESLVCI